MKIVLASLEDSQINAWKKWFSCKSVSEFVQIFKGSILDAGCSCVVSPANSFGFMDGGLDSLYSQKFGWGLQSRVQEKIQREYHGELLVGQAFFIGTGARLPDPRNIIVAPTMRVPSVLPKKTINPYLATRAALREVKEYELGSVAFPGMGTGVGKVDPEICAMQMREAVDEVVLGLYMFPQGWADATARHAYLATGEDVPFERQSREAFKEN